MTKAAVNVGKVLAKGSAKAATSYLSGGLLSASQIQTLFEGEVESKAIAAGLAELVDQSAAAALSNVLEEYSKSSENVGALHKALAKVAEVLTGGKPNGKILFVIDELDRCRPNFSIDVIEVVKHFYSTEHVSFVLAADFQQIETSIRHCYGREIDARRYLEKFYDFKLNFPQKAQTKNSAALQYTKYAIAQMVDGASEERYLEDLMEQLFELTDRIDISIRTLQKIIACVNIARSQMKESALRAPPIVIALCVTKVLFPEIYRELATGRGTPEQLMDCFGLTHSDAYSVSTISQCIGCWKYCLLPDEQLKPFISADPQLDDPAARSIQLWADLRYQQVQRKRIFPTVARRFIDNFEVAS